MKKIKKSGETPVMRQFYSVKEEYPDALILFRMGDFYETFAEDAKIASEILNITLTKRANGKGSTVPLAGFPYHSLDSYMHKLLKAGLKVAICEQVEDPKTAKGIVKREVVEVVTPGTSVSDKFLEDKNNNFLVAIKYTKQTAGISAIDISTGEFFLVEVPKAQMKERVIALSPVEIICIESSEQEIRSLFGLNVLRLTPLDPWMFNFDDAYNALTEHFNTKSLKGFGIEETQYGISAAGAILSYLKLNHQTNLDHVTKINHQTDDNIVLIDDFTRRNLEIFQTMQNNGKDGSLINVLDKTITSMGSRLLKKWLIRPLYNVREIQLRLDQVDHYFKNYNERETLRENLKSCSDLERLLAKLSTNRANARDLLLLKNTLKILPALLFNIRSNEIFSNIISDIDFLEHVVELLDSTIKDEDLPLSTKNGGFLLDGYDRELDEYRHLMRNGKQWIADLQSSEREKLGINSLKVGYNKVFGYYIEIRRMHSDKIPPDYIRKQTLVNAERFITEDLKIYEEKLLSAEEKVAEIENRIFQEIREKILIDISKIQNTARVISTLDVLAGLSYLAELNGYIKPEINNGCEIIIKDGRHPVVEDLLPAGDKFVPNDLKIDNMGKQIFIITGPNMSGKSTYLRQIGLIVLMSQIGSFVPADIAKIGIVDKIFTRVGASDNLAAGESTFLMEMNETANILNNATPKSLVLLDEIGRGTSTYDGMSIAWAVTEYLHNNKKTAAKTLFATHYHELTELEKILPRIGNLNVAVKEYGNKVAFLRKIVNGGCDKSYGIHVAKMAGIPNKVIHRANEIMSNFSTNERVLPTDNINFQKITEENPNQLGLFDQKESELRNKLSNVDINNLTPIEALQKLNEFKKEFGV